MSIVTYPEAAMFVGDDLLAADLAFQLTVDAVQTQISDYCNRDFTYARYVEYPRGLGELAGYRAYQLMTQGVYPYVYLRNWPIILVEDVRVDSFGIYDAGSAYDISRFSFTPGNNGDSRLMWSDGLFFSGRFQRITYWAGYLDANGYGALPVPVGVPALPASLRLAVLKVIGAEWEKGSGQAVGSEHIGDYGYSLITQRQDPGLNPMWLDPSIAALLQQHRSYV